MVILSLTLEPQLLCLQPAGATCPGSKAWRGQSPGAMTMANVAEISGYVASSCGGAPTSVKSEFPSSSSSLRSRLSKLVMMGVMLHK